MEDFLKDKIQNLKLKKWIKNLSKKSKFQNLKLKKCRN